MPRFNVMFRGTVACRATVVVEAPSADAAAEAAFDRLADAELEYLSTEPACFEISKIEEE